MTSTDPQSAELLAAEVGAGRKQRALELVAGLHPADLAHLIDRFAYEDARVLLDWLEPEVAAEVVAELSEEVRAWILGEVEPKRISAVLDAMDTDDAADVLADLPQEVAEQVLPRLEDAREVGALLAYDEESAGGLMATELVAASDEWSVERATEEVRRLAQEVDSIYVVHVVDADGVLRGIVPLMRLLLAAAQATVAEIMETEFVSVDPHTDQEEVARIMARYDLVVLPVVDERGQLLGRITIDDVVDVIREEAEEDLHRMAGSGADEKLGTSVLRTSWGRLVWLLVGLVGALLSALVINSFEEVLLEAVALAMFIPVVMAMAGSTGIQSSALTVQGLAKGRLLPGDLPQRLGKELAVALINGAVLALLFGGVVLALEALGVLHLPPERAFDLALTAGLAMLAVIVIAAALGAVIPLALNRIGVDPALATGPFITTSNDVLGLLIYFGIAAALYL